MKSLDGIVRPTTELEAWRHWMNRMQTQLLQLHISGKKKIPVWDASGCRVKNGVAYHDDYCSCDPEELAL